MTLAQHCPTPGTLDLLDLMHLGAWPTSFTDAYPAQLTEMADGDEVELVDPEGLPLARLTRPAPEAARALSGAVTLLNSPAYGPYRRLYRTAAQAQESTRFASTVVATNRPLTAIEVAALPDEPTVVLALVGDQAPQGLSAAGLLRALLADLAPLPQVQVIAVPLPASALQTRAEVLAHYASEWTELLDPTEAPFSEAAQRVLAHERPAADQQGLVIFFTGLSGSGKSTLARALLDLLIEQGQRSVTSLDGDVVRRHLSAGLSFSKADRETNIRRIGWVAAEISRHRGIAVCSPIAPFAQTRDDVRAMVTEAGGAFFLIHVATPLAECERRDRKGLYAKARAGQIPEFTGISSPYEKPTDADVVVDTTGRTIQAALHDVLLGLKASGYLDLTGAH